MLDSAGSQDIHYRTQPNPSAKLEKKPLKVQNGTGNIKHQEGEEGDAVGTGPNITFQPMNKTIPEQGKSRKGRECLKETTVD